jgi:hypothetical protein
MMGQCMMLCEVVVQISFSGLPVDDELELFDLVMDPVETHVHGFVSALLNSFVGYALSKFMDCLDCSGRLRMTKLL